MTTWTPEGIRRHIFEKLYPLYMESTQAYAVFAVDPSAEDTGNPPTSAVIREAKLLEAAGHVDILGEGVTYINVRLNVPGRLFWEQQMSPPLQQKREPLGFDP